MVDVLKSVILFSVSAAFPKGGWRLARMCYVTCWFSSCYAVMAKRRVVKAVQRWYDGETMPAYIVNACVG